MTNGPKVNKFYTVDSKAAKFGAKALKWTNKQLFLVPIGRLCKTAKLAALSIRRNCRF